jgi:hypothetical protein
VGLGAENPVRIRALVLPTGGATGRVGGDSLLPHLMRKFLAPIAKRGFVDSKPLPDLVLGLDDQVDVGMVLVGMQRQPVTVAGELLPLRANLRAASSTFSGGVGEGIERTTL